MKTRVLLLVAALVCVLPFACGQSKFEQCYQTHTSQRTQEAVEHVEMCDSTAGISHSDEASCVKDHALDRIKSSVLTEHCASLGKKPGQDAGSGGSDGGSADGGCNQCSAPGVTQCPSMSAQQTCIAGANNCLVWGAVQACSGSQMCHTDHCQ